MTVVDLIVLFDMDSLNKTRSLFYIKVHEVKKALIKDIGPVNRVHLTVLVRIEKSLFSVSGNYKLKVFLSLGAATLKTKFPVRLSVLGTSREFFIFDLIL